MMQASGIIGDGDGLGHCRLNDFDCRHPPSDDEDEHGDEDDDVDDDEEDQEQSHQIEKQECDKMQT